MSSITQQQQKQQRARSDARGQRLVEAARSVLHSRGFEADIRDILRVAAIGTGTAYRHFATKEALVRAVIEEMKAKVEEGLRRAAAIEDARAAIAACMRVGFQALERYGQLAVALFGGAAPEEYSDCVDREALERFFGELVERGREQGHFRSDVDVQHAVGVWFALTAPCALSRLMEREGRSVVELSELTTRFYLAGMSHTLACRS